MPGFNNRFKKEWEPTLTERMTSILTDKDELTKLIFSQTDYQDRKTRDSNAQV